MSKKPVVIMAAGKGTRMLPLTEKVPKVLVEVNRKPFLYYLIKNLEEAGYSEFGVIAGYKIEQLEQFMDQYEVKGKIIEQKEQLGTAHAISCAEDFVNGRDFIALGGDNLWSPEDLKKMDKDDDFTYVAGKEVENPSRYGVLVVNGEHLIGIEEKPERPKSNLISTGLYKFTPEIFEKIKSVEKSSRGEYELVDGITSLINEKKVKVEVITDYWKDFGCLKDIPLMEAFLKNEATIIK